MNKSSILKKYVLLLNEVKTMTDLIRVSKPRGDLSKVQGTEPFQVKGWTVIEFYDCESGNYYEKAVRGSAVKWFKQVDEIIDYED